ncbi:isochorismatase domain-containing protein 1-like [Melitaea cinxia]|uniref:isochorismatase domain-containing protein 1-like n=1 Tax=Melitaea cinxia TaxID=113334 RepID=UPI001E271F28|nr:isochorismatase domain-containing protein 1-like [Melitaea cinxia]
MTRNLFRLGALEANKTAFFLCDMQEKFRPQIKYFDEIVRTANKMIKGAKFFKIPVYVSEYETITYGSTVVDIDISEAAFVYNKEDLSMYNETLKKLVKKDVPGLNSVVIFGIAAHACVEQTAIDLLNEDINVHVLADGVSSRSILDRSLALRRLQSMGCILGTSENVLLKLLGGTKHPAYEQISKLIKSKPTPDCRCG